MLQKYIQNNLENLQFNFLTIIISLMIAPLFAGIFGKYLYFSQKYSEFTVGTITFLGVSKNADYMIMIGFAVGFVLTFVLSNKVLNRLEEHEKDKFNALALYSMIPATIWIGSLFFTKELSLDLLILSSTLLVLLLLVYIFVTKQSDEIFLYSIIGTFFILLSVMGLHVFFNRYFAQSSQWLLSFQNPYLSIKFFKYFSVIFILNVLIYCKFFDYKKNILLISQIFIPLIFMMLIPSSFLKDGAAIQIYPIDKNLYLFVGVLIFISYIFYTRRFFNNGLKIWDSMPTFNAIAILFLLKSAITNIPSVSADDYHFGEFLLPYWSLIEFHSLPFVDLVPARGLINYMDGFLANLFFDLKASYFHYIYNFLLLFYVAILFYIVRVYFGFIVAFFVTLLFPNWNLGVSGIDIFNTVLLLILFFEFLSKNYKRFLLWSLVIVTVSILS
ncbi:MAG: hypothetical protein KN64_01025 [Sulfurovum sp. AS07-7]|nr:MAG: hypothetical protein KN64_01025 [Sulfurovum sp. AS07-7]